MRDIIHQEDYVGFTFNGIHSSQFGLKSVSNGDRYSKYLFPEFTDSTQALPDRNGTLFYRSTFSRKTFNLNIAFDDITELELREIQEWLGDQQIHKLIFDERPYIYYNAKVAQSIQFNYLTFAGATDSRVYKGEFSFTFVCYDPFGYSEFNYLPTSPYPNQDEWVGASRLLTQTAFNNEKLEHNYNSSAYGNGRTIPIFNCGDFDVDFDLEIVCSNSTTTGAQSLQLLTYEKVSSGTPVTTKIAQLDLNFGTGIAGTLKIDSARRSLVLESGGNTQLRNDLWVGGDFFQIPKCTENQRAMIKLDAGSSGGAAITTGNFRINLHYKYY